MSGRRQRAHSDALPRRIPVAATGALLFSVAGAALLVYVASLLLLTSPIGLFFVLPLASSIAGALATRVPTQTLVPVQQMVGLGMTVVGASVLPLGLALALAVGSGADGVFVLGAVCSALGLCFSGVHWILLGRCLSEPGDG